MKQNIHPSTHPVIFVDVSTKDEIITSSTVTSDETRDIDGVKHYVIKVDITSFSHPFYTGELRFVDEKGRVAEFQERLIRAQAKQKQAEERAAKKNKQNNTPQEDPQSYQELLRQQQQALRTAKTEQVN